MALVIIFPINMAGNELVNFGDIAANSSSMVSGADSSAKTLSMISLYFVLSKCMDLQVWYDVVRNFYIRIVQQLLLQSFVEIISVSFAWSSKAINSRAIPVLRLVLDIIAFIVISKLEDT